MHAQRRLGTMRECRRDPPGARHAMPLVAQASGEQPHREPCRSGFGHLAIRRGVEACTPVGVREYAVGVTPGLPLRAACRKRPLLRAMIQQRVIQAADIQVAANRERAMLVENLRRVLECEQALPAHWCQARFQPARHLVGNPPIRTCLPGCFHRLAHASDSAFGVGHRAVLLAPAGGRQQHVGIRHGVGTGKGLLHDHQFGVFQRGANAGNLRHRMYGVGAHDPHRLERARAQPLEQLHGRCACRWRDSPAGTPHSRSSSARSSAFAISRCAASMVAMPPTSRPPIALG